LGVPVTGSRWCAAADGATVMSVYLIVPALPAAWQIEILSSCFAGVFRADNVSAPIDAATMSARNVDPFQFFIAGSLGKGALPEDSGAESTLPLGRGGARRSEPN